MSPTKSWTSLPVSSKWHRANDQRLVDRTQKLLPWHLPRPSSTSPSSLSAVTKWSEWRDGSRVAAHGLSQKSPKRSRLTHVRLQNNFDRVSLIGVNLVYLFGNQLAETFSSLSPHRLSQFGLVVFVENDLESGIRRLGRNWANVTQLEGGLHTHNLNWILKK